MHECYLNIVIIMFGGTMGIIKTVGSSGQISLGKKFAGQNVMLDEIEA
jgi:hypothetical protein